jgi:hypothetical protein
MFTSNAPRRIFTVLLMLAALIGVTVLSIPAPVTATEISQSVIVNPNPVNNTPHVLDGRVLQFGRIGNTIYVGGTFTQVQAAAAGSPVLNRSRAFAFDVTTGAISTTWTPNLNGEVNSIQVMPDGTGVFLGGAFTTVNGAASRGVAKVHPTTGARITAFSAPTNGKVSAMALSRTRLFVGGRFTQIRGVARQRLADVNTTTGVVNALNVPITDPYTVGTAPEVDKMDVTPAGDRMVIVGNFRTVGGQTRVQLAQVNLTTNTVASWRTDDLDVGRCSESFYRYPRDVQYAPNGSYFAMVTTGAGFFPQTLCDTTTRWETYEEGSERHPTWVDYSGGDTLYGVAITGAAIYVGGHQRWMNNAPVGDIAAEGAVAREGIAALDPQSGRPFAWNPGRARGVGVFDMLAVPQGLLVGSDTIRLGGETHRRLGMFPVAGGVTPVFGQPTQLPGDLYMAPLKNCAEVDDSILFRVNTGGGELEALDCGPNWADDTGSSPYRNDNSNVAGWSHVPNVDGTVPPSTPSEVFDSERWYQTDEASESWEFPVGPNTDVRVRLYFANRYEGTSQIGQRVFDVSLEGTIVLNDYDIVADVGDQRGTMKQFDRTVTDGSVSVDFDHVVENPLINAIEIIDRDVPGGPAPGSAESLSRFASFSGNALGSPITLATPGIDWSTARGTFLLNGRVYAGFQNGDLLSWAFNGTSLTNQQDVLAQGGYVLGPNWISFSPLTGMYWKDGRLYYTKQGDDRLFYRGFSADSELVGSVEYVADDGGWAGVRGMTEAGGFVFYATPDGNLHRIADDARGMPFGTDTLIGGPGIDGRDYRSSGMFVLD